MHYIPTKAQPLGERFFKIRNILIGILFLNWAVAFAKIIYGYVSHSTAMSADGFHSFADGSSNIIGIIGIWAASQPVDKEHPYGHKKFETFTSIIIAILLFIISFNLLRGGIMRLIHPVSPEVTSISFIVMLCTIAVNVGVYLYESGRARVLQSDILAADAQHTKSDILVSVSVIFTLIAVRSGFPMLDTLVSMAIAFFIAHGAVHILKDSSAVLCDQAPVVADEIKDIVMTIEGIKGAHKIRTRGRVDDIHIDLHILVDPNMSIGSAHEFNDKIEEAIRAKIAGVTDIAIHMEPYRDSK
ncbi:cation diffusion facilitator family transporter [Candidatus Omnitrophota bacterium]